MVKINGPAWFDARIRRAFTKLDPSEYRHIREINYEGSNPLARARGIEGVVGIFDLGLAEDDVGLASVLAHENVHAGTFSMDEFPSIDAEVAVLRRHGRHARADQILAWSRSQQFDDSIKAYYSNGSAVASAGASYSQPAAQPQHQPAAQATTQQGEQPLRGMAAWQAAYLENRKRRKFLAWFP